MIHIKRVYEPMEPGDGRRFLVDRLWPRGVKKEELHLDGWLKGAAPSDALRQWFGHAPDRSEEFCLRYRQELTANAEAWFPLLEAARGDDVILLYGARDPERNNAVVLRSFIEEQLSMEEEDHGADCLRG